MVKSGKKWELFTGSYTSRIDEKKRLLIPRSFRVTRTFVLQPEHPASIGIYPLNVWKRIYSAVELKGESKRVFERIIFSQVVFLEVDKLGRIILPKHLLLHAGIKVHVAVIGCGMRFEVWDMDKWRRYFKQSVRKMPWKLI